MVLVGKMHSLAEIIHEKAGAHAIMIMLPSSLFLKAVLIGMKGALKMMTVHSLMSYLQSLGPLFFLLCSKQQKCLDAK